MSIKSGLAEWREEFPGGIRQCWNEIRLQRRADRAERLRRRSLSTTERQFEAIQRHENAAYAQVTDHAPNPQLAAQLMEQIHGAALLRVEVNQAVIVAILRDGQALEYDALGRLLTR